MPSDSITAVPTGKFTIAPSTGGTSGRNINGTLEVIAVLALVALLAGLVGLFMTRNRALPVAAAEAEPAPPVDPPTVGLFTPPAPDTVHDWTSQTPGPPPPPPPPGATPDEDVP